MNLSLPRLLETHTTDKTHQDSSSSRTVMDRLRTARESEPRSNSTSNRATMTMAAPPNSASDQQHWLLQQQQQQQQQYGGGSVDQPRSVLARVLGTATDQPMQETHGAYTNGGGGVYGRLSEPASVSLMEDTRGLEAEAQRRSLPMGHRGEVAQDMSWALQSIQEQSRGRAQLLNTPSASMYAPRNPRPFLGSVSAGPYPGSRPAYQLSRAHSADVMQRTEPVDELSQLRQTVAALKRNLEEESRRRANDSKQYESRIFELQTLIRRNMPEQRRELERNMHTRRPSQQAAQQPAPAAAPCPTRTPQQQSVPPATSRGRALRANPNAPVPGPYVAMRQLSEMEREDLVENGHDDEEEDGEDNREDVELEEETQDIQDNQRNCETVRQAQTKMKQQLTALRARMRTEVAHAAGEVTVLTQRLEEQRNEHARKEAQLHERVVFLEERRRHAKQKLQTKLALVTSEFAVLKDENQRLHEQLAMRDLRIQQLELAVGGRSIVASYQKSNQISHSSNNNNNHAEPEALDNNSSVEWLPPKRH